MDYEKKFLLNDHVKGQRTFNGEIIEGKFNGFYLHDKLDSTSVIGVICVEGDRCYDVLAGSIELLESENERIRKGIIQYLEQSQFGEEHYQIDDDVVRNYIAWLEKQGDRYTWGEYDEYQINTILHELDLKRKIYKKEGNKVEEERYNMRYNWLKSFKERMKVE